MNKFFSVIYIFTFIAPGAFGSLYRNWASIAKANFKRGRETYQSLFNNIQERENDCISLISIDKHISDNFPVDLEFIEKSKEPFPCLTQLQKNEKKFDIDLESDALTEMNYTKILQEAGCWRFVINEINSLDVERCDFKGEASRSLIALAKTKCHFLRASRKFPSRSDGCVLNPSSLSVQELNSILQLSHGEDPSSEFSDYSYNPCSVDYSGSECEKVKRKIVSHCTNNKVMSEAAFQMYHSDLNHIDNICFYLQSSEWNRRTERNISNLTDSANHMLTVYKTVRDQFDVLNSQQADQLNKAENLTLWIDSIKTDIGQVLRIIRTVKDYQRRILDFITNFKTYCTYLLFGLIGLVSTSFEFAAKSRLKVLIAIVISCFIETLFNRLFNGWLDVDMSKYLSNDEQQFIIKFIRTVMFCYIVIEWFHSLVSYKPEWKIMLSEVKELKKSMANPVVYVSNDSLSRPGEVRYTLDDFVEKFGDDDSEYVDESGDSSDYDSDEALDSDSEASAEQFSHSNRPRRSSRRPLRHSPMLHF